MDEPSQALNTNADAVQADFVGEQQNQKMLKLGHTNKGRNKPSAVVSNPAIQLKAATLRGAGYTIDAIAKELGIAYVTAYKLVKATGVDDTLKRATRTVKSAIPQIAKMTTREILEKKDRRLGFEVLRESGVLAEINPRKEQPDAGRITFEFNFPPPPWAPRPVIEASQPKPIDATDAEIVQDNPSESAAELHTLDTPVDVPSRD